MGDYWFQSRSSPDEAIIFNEYDLLASHSKYREYKIAAYYWEDNLDDDIPIP